MPVANEGAEWSLREQQIRRSIGLLEEAMSLIDQIGAYPDLGARIAGIIDVLNDNIKLDGQTVQFGSDRRPFSTEN